MFPLSNAGFPNEVFYFCLSVQRFVSKRSYSSVDLASFSASSSLDDVRAEPGRHCLVCRSELATSQPAAVRRTLQLAAAVGTCSSGSAYSGQAGGNQETPSPDRSLTRRSPTSALQPLPPPRPPQLLHSSKTSPAAAVRSAAKFTSTPSCVTGSSTSCASGGQNGDGACSSAYEKSSTCAPGCSTGSTRTLPTAGNGACHEQRRSAGRLCCHPLT